MYEFNIKGICFHSARFSVCIKVCTLHCNFIRVSLCKRVCAVYFSFDALKLHIRENCIFLLCYISQKNIWYKHKYILLKRNAMESQRD